MFYICIYMKTLFNTMWKSKNKCLSKILRSKIYNCIWIIVSRRHFNHTSMSIRLVVYQRNVVQRLLFTCRLNFRASTSWQAWPPKAGVLHLANPRNTFKHTPCSIAPSVRCLKQYWTKTQKRWYPKLSLFLI